MCLNNKPITSLYEPQREKTGLRGFRHGLTQTDLFEISDLRRREIVLSVWKKKRR